jgi:transposase
MNKICIGVDISMDEFHACIKVRFTDGSVKVKGTRTFKNTSKGHLEFF